MNYKENCEYLVVDVEQYADDADVIIDSLMKVKEAVNTKIIIYAVAFSPKSELLSGLYSRGIRNYIFSEMFSDKKKDLTNCINGFMSSGVMKVWEYILRVRMKIMQKK